MTEGSDERWTPVRRDFVDPGTHCARRSPGGRRHGIPGHHADILRDELGHEALFCAACAATAVTDAEALLWMPDYTVRDAGIAATSAAASSAGNRRRTPAQIAAQQRAAAIRYLVLRADKVAAVPRIQPTVRYLPLDEIHAEFLRTGELGTAQVRRIEAIERSAATPPTLKATNLLDVYTAHIKLAWLMRESNRLERTRFLRGLVDWLARHLLLTRAQIAAAGLELHPHAFHSILADEENGELF